MSIKTAEEAIEDYRDELAGYLKECYEFHESENVKDVLKKISAFRARAAMLRNGIIKSKNQQIIRFRIDELDPFLNEMSEQFKIWSRINSVEQLEWDMSRG